MNNVKFYRLRPDGSVDMVAVKACQPSLDELTGVQKYGSRKPKKRTTPTVRELENHMLRHGWTRNKLKPTKPLSMYTAVARAMRSLAA